MKKKLSLFSCVTVLVLLLSSLLPLSVGAVEAPLPPSEDFYVGVREDAPAYYHDLYNGMMACKASISIEKYELSEQAALAAMQDLMNLCPELFHVNSRYSVRSRGEVIVSFEMTYRLSGAELEAARRFCHSELLRIADTVPDWLSDFEICLFLHDSICARFGYDPETEAEQINYDIYSFLQEGEGVCQAYTLLYSALLSYFRIPVDYAVSTAMNHIWNLVTLDGETYHVDITWDDAVDPTSGDYFGRAMHANFLRSDDGIAATEHYAWTSEGEVLCTDTRYDESGLADYNSGFAFADERLFGIRNGQIFELDRDSLAPSLFYTIQASWSPYQSPAVYQDKYAGLYGHRDRLYFNTGTTVFSLELLSKQTTSITTVNDGVIFALTGVGNELRYLVARNAERRGATIRAFSLPELNDACETHTYQLEVHVPPTYSQEGLRVLRCDVCHNRKEETLERLSLPTLAAFSAMVDAVEEAEGAEEYLAAVKEPLGARDYMPPEAAEEVARLDALIAAYDETAETANADSLETTLTALLTARGGYLTAASRSVLAVLIVMLSKLFGGVAG